MPLLRRPQSLSFRALLACVLLLLLGGTMGVLVALSTWFGTRNFRELTQTISQQTLAHVQADVQLLLQRAVDQNRQVVQLLASRSVAPTNFPLMGAFLADSLEAQPSLARLTIVADPSGDFVQSERLTNGQIRIREGQRVNGDSLSVTHWEWRGSNRVVSAATILPGGTVLDDAGFREARARGRSVWSVAHAWDATAPQGRWGIRYATPLREADGALRGFVGTSLTLGELNRYLRQLDRQVPGYVAVVEESGPDRPFRLLGHPHSELVGREISTDSVLGEKAAVEPVLFGYVRALAADPRMQSGQLRLGDFGREFIVGGTNYLGSFQRLQGSADPRWILIMLMPRSEVAGGVEQNLRWAAAAAAGFLLLAAVVVLALARRIAEPMRQLSADAHAMSQLEFDARPRPLSAIREVRQLEEALGDARASLRSFRKYVPADVVNSLVTRRVEATLGGQSARLTLLFSDVVDFTRLAETVSAQKLVEHLGEYLAAVSTVIQKHQGTVDKFIGDGVMAFWGAPKPNPNHALDACTAAWRVQQCLDELNSRWRAAGEVPFPTRIGLNTGSVIVGNIGSESRMNYTAVGDPVNVASRLESLNRAFGTRILLSDETRLAAGDTLLTRPVARVAVKGSQRGLVVHELLGLVAEPDPPAQRLAERTTPAFLACELGRWKESLQLYDEVLREFPDDPVARVQREFIEQNEGRPRASDTEVVRRMTAK